MRRIFVSLALVASLVFVSAGFDACKQTASEKERNLAYARDVVVAFEKAEPVVRAINPSTADVIKKGIPIAKDVVTAIEQSDADNALKLLRDLIPILNGVYAQFSGNVKVLSIIALADIALHFLINHMAPKIVSPGKAQRMRTEHDVIAEYAAQPVWGCTYLPERCFAQ